MSVHSLTEEQKKKIAENRQKALAKRIERQSPVKCNLAQQGFNSERVQECSGTKGIVVTSELNVNCNHIPSGSTTFRCTVNVNYSNPGAAPVTHSERSTVSSSQQNYAGPREKQNYAGPREKLSRSSGGAYLSGRCVLAGSDVFCVEIGYSAALIQYFKQWKTKSYDSATKLWSFKMEEYDAFIKGAHSFQPDIKIDGLPRWIVQMFSPNKNSTDIIPSADLSKVDEKLVQALLPFQRESVNLAIHRSGRLLIADDMGLGKTLQAICIACYYRNEWPLLIVSPSSVRYDWAQQICKWLPSVEPCDVNVVDSGRTSSTSGIINIISYDLLSRKASEMKKVFRVVIMDESHFLKNTKTARTKAAAPLLKNAKRIILLSGTPALSRPSELFSQITAVCPDLFKFHDFGVRYCNAKQMPWGWDYSGSSNMMELQLLLEKKIMIRRQKKDVLSQLPPKYRQVVMLDPSSVQKHKGLNVASSLMSSSKLKGLSKRGALLEYFHETCKSKLSAVRDYIMDLVEAQEKFLVFAHHKEMLDCIEDGIKSQAPNIEYIRIDGRTTSEQRSFLCNKFQTNENYRVAILSVTAANAGLNLSAANIVVFSELFWNPGILVQAEDRAHRIGQQDSVTVQYLVALHTADDYIWPLVQNKLDILSKAGLTKDDFADSDTKRLRDNTQQTLMDMFSSEFIDCSSPEMVNVDEEHSEAISTSGQRLDTSSVPLSQANAKLSASRQQLDMADAVLSQSNAKSRETKNATRHRTPQKSFPGDWTRKISPSQKVSRSQLNPNTQGDKTPSKRQASITKFFDHTPPKKKLCLDDEPNLVTQHVDIDVNAIKKEPGSNVSEKEKPHKGVDGIRAKTSWLDSDIAADWLDEDINMTKSLKRSKESVLQSDISPLVSQESMSTTPSVTQEDLSFIEDINWDDDM